MPAEPALTLGSPRTQAAMRVLGILPKDIQPRDRLTFQEGVPGEVRHEAWEKKRRQLMQNVSGMAQDKSLDLSKSPSEAALVGQPSAATNAFLADVMAREAVSMAKMRSRAQADVQKIVIDEMAQKAQVEVRNAKLEEHRKRMVELKKKQDEKLAAQKKEAEKKLAKTIEVRARADRILEEESQKLASEIAEKDTRVEACLQAREEGWANNRVTKQAERDQKYVDIALFKAGELGVREKMYAGVVKRTAASEVRLAEIQDELQAHQAAKSDRTNGVIARARSELGKQQGEKDQAYLERLKVHDKKKEFREANAKEYQKYFLEKNKKEKANHAKNYERALKEREVVLVSPRMTKAMSANFTTSPAWLTESSAKAFETHKSMGEIRQLNLQLLKRAHQYHQVQALSHIEDMRHRVKALKDSKDEAQYRRFQMMKNCAIEKHHLTFQVQKVRDAPPERMNSLLEKMGMEPIKTGKEEGDEEAEGKK